MIPGLSSNLKAGIPWLLTMSFLLAARLWWSTVHSMYSA